MTVKNEERILRKNILYHQSIGVSHFFIYFDGTTDKGRESIIDLENVTSSKSVSKETYQNNQSLELFIDRYVTHHTARQCLNTHDAKQQCKRDGIDWLISIDPDELVVPDNKKDVISFFKDINQKIDLVHFNVYECLQRKEHYTDVFREEVLFKRETPFIRNSFFPDILNTGRVKNSYVYGHSAGKAALRVNSQIIPWTVHTYTTSSGTPPNTIHVGKLLHYHSYDFEDFMKKFTNFRNYPSTLIHGDLSERQKKFFVNLVNSSNLRQKELRSFFTQHILFSRSELFKIRLMNFIYRILMKNPILIKETFVSKKLQKIDDTYKESSPSFTEAKTEILEKVSS